MGDAMQSRTRENSTVSAAGVFRELMMRAQDNGYRMTEAESSVIRNGFTTIFYREILGGIMTGGAVYLVGRLVNTNRTLRWLAAVTVGLSSAGWTSHFEQDRLVGAVAALENSPVAVETKIILAESEGLEGPFQKQLGIKPIDFQAFGLTVYDFVSDTDAYLGLCELIPDNKRVGRPSNTQRDMRSLENIFKGPPPRPQYDAGTPSFVGEDRPGEPSMKTKSAAHERNTEYAIEQDDSISKLKRGTSQADRPFEPAEVWNVDAYEEDLYAAKPEFDAMPVPSPGLNDVQDGQAHLDPFSLPTRDKSMDQDLNGREDLDSESAQPQYQDLKPSERRALERQARRHRASRHD